MWALLSLPFGSFAGVWGTCDTLHEYFQIFAKRLAEFPFEESMLVVQDDSRPCWEARSNRHPGNYIVIEDGLGNNMAKYFSFQHEISHGGLQRLRDVARVAANLLPTEASHFWMRMRQPWHDWLATEEQSMQSAECHPDTKEMAPWWSFPSMATNVVHVGWHRHHHLWTPQRDWGLTSEASSLADRLAPFYHLQPWPGSGLWPRCDLCDVWADHSHISSRAHREACRRHPWIGGGPLIAKLPSERSVHIWTVLPLPEPIAAPLQARLKESGPEKLARWDAEMQSILADGPWMKLRLRSGAENSLDGPHGPPSVAPDESAATERWPFCLRCNKWATVDHVSSKKHQKRTHSDKV